MPAQGYRPSSSDDSDEGRKREGWIPTDIARHMRRCYGIVKQGGASYRSTALECRTTFNALAEVFRRYACAAAF